MFGGGNPHSYLRGGARTVLESSDVFCATSPARDYGYVERVDFPELGGELTATCALITLRNLLAQAGLDRDRFGKATWNPLGGLIASGSRVVVKPNWVLHENACGETMDCMVTHTSVLEAILHYVLKADPGGVVVGDAPVQRCDFAALCADRNIGSLSEAFGAARPRFSVKDFRRTVLPSGKLGAPKEEDRRSLEEYVLFDLGGDSALEPITSSPPTFRVTKYDPSLLEQRHAPGRHQYLISRDVMEAEVVINAPKLKTHKKAAVTGALKNLVGINGNKEFLPHHRKGGSLRGGDCYPGCSRLKELVEDLTDAANRGHRPRARRAYAWAARGAYWLSRVLGVDSGYSGSWYGNDTVWRMCLDLQRILHYGRPDGTLADTVQRRVISITDAIIAGEGEGPLAPTPVPLGMVTLGSNPATAEWVHALLMGLNPQAIPLVREAFASHRYPLVTLAPCDIRVFVDGETVSADEVHVRFGHSFRPPKGWVGHCELGAGCSWRG